MCLPGVRPARVIVAFTCTVGEVEAVTEAVMATCGPASIQYSAPVTLELPVAESSTSAVRVTWVGLFRLVILGLILRLLVTGPTESVAGASAANVAEIE